MKLETGDVVKATSLMGECWQHSERGECLGKNVTVIGPKDGGYEVNVFLDGGPKSFVFAPSELSELD